MSIPGVSEWPWSTRIAAGVFAVTLVAGSMLSMDDNASRAETHAPLVLPRPAEIIISTPDNSQIVRDALARAPFGGESQADNAYQPGSVVQQSIPLPVRAPRLVGTVLEGAGGFVIVELPDGRMPVIRIGEKAGEYRLREVRAGEAIFEDARGGRVSLKASAAGADIRP